MASIPGTGFERRALISPYAVVVPTLSLIGFLSGRRFSPMAAGISALVGLGWGLLVGRVAQRLGRRERQRARSANVSIQPGVAPAGTLFGTSLFGNNFFYMFNTLLDWLVLPAVLYLSTFPRRRSLILVDALRNYAARMGTYIYFVPNIFEFMDTPAGAPPSALRALGPAFDGEAR